MSVSYDDAAVAYDSTIVTYDGVVLLVTRALPVAKARTQVVQPGRARHG